MLTIPSTERVQDAHQLAGEGHDEGGQVGLMRPLLHVGVDHSTVASRYAYRILGRLVHLDDSVVGRYGNSSSARRRVTRRAAR